MMQFNFPVYFHFQFIVFWFCVTKPVYKKMTSTVYAGKTLLCVTFFTMSTHKHRILSLHCAILFAELLVMHVGEIDVVCFIVELQSRVYFLSLLTVILSPKLVTFRHFFDIVQHV